MKRLMIALLAIVLAASLCGCGKEAPAPTAASTEPTVPRPTLASIAETVLFETEDIKITAKAMHQDNTKGWVEVLLENSTQQDITFAGDGLIINGLTVSSGFSISAEAGADAVGQIAFSFATLDNSNIRDIARIECPDAWIFENIEYLRLHDAPFRIETAVAGSYQQPMGTDGKLLYSKDGLEVRLLAVTPGTRNTDIRLFITNDTENDITLRSKDLTADGAAVNGWLQELTYAGTSRCCRFEISGTGYKSITMVLAAVDTANHNAVLFNTGILPLLATPAA